MACLNPITYVHHRLPNGLQVVVSPDNVAPVVAVNLWYDVGSRHERPGRTGFAHLFEHLMFEGSTHVRSGEHMRTIQEAGGAVNGTTATERTNYTATVPVEQLELVLWMESDRMSGLLDVVTQQALDKQRDIVKNERRQRYDNQPYGTAIERLMTLLFPPTHPYHHMPIGSMDDLDAAALEDVHDFFRSHYAPDNAVLTLVGDIDPDRAVELVTKHLGHVPPAGSLPQPPDGTLDEPLPAGVRETLVEDVPFPALYKGYRLPAAGHPDLDSVEVALAVLVNGRASVLQRRLVRGGFAQGVGRALDVRVAGASIGMLIATACAGVGVETLEAVVDEEIGRLANTGPTESELERARARLERGRLDAYTGLARRADELSKHTMRDGDPGRINDVLPRLLAVTVGDVQAAVAEHFAERHPAVLEYRALAKELAA